jgi:hypothetical protein
MQLGKLASFSQRNEIHSAGLYSTIKIIFSWQSKDEGGMVSIVMLSKF